MSYGDAQDKFLTSVRDENSRLVGVEGEWHDVHATTVLKTDSWILRFRRMLTPR